MEKDTQKAEHETDTSTLPGDVEEEVEEIVDIKVSEKLEAINTKLNELFETIKKPVVEASEDVSQSGAQAVDVVIDKPVDMVEETENNGKKTKKRSIRRKRFI